MDFHAAAELFPSAGVFCNPRVLGVYSKFCSADGEDSKSLVDRPLKVHPETFLRAFDSLYASLHASASKPDVCAFFERHLEPEPDASAAPHVPEDYNERPPQFTARLRTSPAVTAFAHALKRIWPHLCRVNVTSGNGADASVRSSLVPLPSPFFVAGGRFRECYYWDSFWIVKGLLASDMPTSARHVAENLCHLVTQVGFVPNGNRVYYLNRSQPPVLSLVVGAIYEHSAHVHCETDQHSKVADWVCGLLPLLDREYESFVSSHAPLEELHENARHLAVYRVNASMPRPESWKEDVRTAQRWLQRRGSGERSDGNDRSASEFPECSQLYSDVAAAAESGWDFSTRWLDEPDAGLSSLCTSQVIPVCLNSILCAVEQTLGRLHFVAENTGESRRYDSLRHTRMQAINDVLWNEKEGIWCDFNVKKKESCGRVAASGLMPLWAQCWPDTWGENRASTFIEKLRQRKLLQDGGIAVTECESGEQWDFPNMWPPLVDTTVAGLENLSRKFPESGAHSVAKRIAETALRSMHASYATESVMHEKYDATSLCGGSGGGGEYEPQVGFGWTNGVALELMRKGYSM